MPSITAVEVSKLHPYFQISAEGCTSITESGEACTDLDLPAIVTADDFWEAAYREERSKREDLENVIRTLCREHNIYQEGVQVNDMLKEMLHMHLHNTQRHRKNIEENGMSLLDESTVEEFGSNGNFELGSGGNASFPSPPPSPIADIAELDFEDNHANSCFADSSGLNSSGVTAGAITPELVDNSSFVEIDVLGSNQSHKNGTESSGSGNSGLSTTGTSEFLL
jgi:hypothetical protein